MGPRRRMLEVSEHIGNYANNLTAKYGIFQFVKLIYIMAVE